MHRRSNASPRRKIGFVGTPRGSNGEVRLGEALLRLGGLDSWKLRLRVCLGEGVSSRKQKWGIFPHLYQKSSFQTKAKTNQPSKLNLNQPKTLLL